MPSFDPMLVSTYLDTFKMLSVRSFAHFVTLSVGVCFVLGMASTSDAQSVEIPFYFGVDLSYVNEMDDCGAVYQENGESHDAFVLFARHGANLVRARLWHSPTWTTYSTLADVERTFARAHEQGMATLLAIHYSDTWADPNHQEIPSVWVAIEDENALADAVYTYTADVLGHLYAVDLLPDYIQIGNEINAGLLKQVVGLDWPRDAKLINAGIRAVRDFATATNTSPQIILHVAQPENTAWWFFEAEQAGITDFDVIGFSYYPQWSSFSIEQTGTQVTYLKQQFGKAVMVVETGYGWTHAAVDETANNLLDQEISGYPFTPAGQRQFMIDLTQTLITNGAIGVAYWEPAWVSTLCVTPWGQGSHWENATFFDFQNHNEVHDGITYLTYAYSYPEN